MANAIISRIYEDPAFCVTVTNRDNQSRLQDLKDRYQIEFVTHWSQFIAKADIIILAFPPELHKEVLTEMRPYIQNQCVITIAGGYTLSALEKLLPPKTAAAWLMPNTASQLGESMTLYTCNQYVAATEREKIVHLLKRIGSYQLCTETQIQKLTAITGSASAFLYYFAESLEQIATSYGLSETDARQMVSQMIYGSAHLLQQGDSPAFLRDQVTTPGGSTAAGVEILEQNQFKTLMQKAVQATNERAEQLSNLK
ncbi:pyrroline-5-carboxylate reductase [Hazenella sp. IB182357]|uniref:Pyrroline-5-carboxylate reductase n=2 Tax=Polycladospora coralii TaxID=2771432 RepID=A0A926N8V1_9BACL|nr:pyrroline-5-carboxylate reductase [Polycladospora coralii]MBS7530462.1 pyrroline-5-carboxylate reductase [Polycladospora coralii]